MTGPPGPSGVRVPGYADLVEIGRGGHAVVYRARQVAFDRVVALKVLARVDVDGQALRRFERECKAAGALSWHPHIVAVYDAGTTEAGTPYLAMEYLEAGTFATRLAREGRLPWSDVVEIAIQTCGALETAHRAGTLHRDVKPENILVGPYGEARLADFGIAAVQHDPATLTSAGLVTATVAHAAPELFAGGRASPVSDVYSLGSTMFTLLAGKTAFVEPTDEVFAAAILRLTTAPPPDLRPNGVPSGVAQIVEWTMAKEPADRPQSAEALGRALQDLQRETGQPITDMRLRVAPRESPPPAAGGGGGGGGGGGEGAPGAADQASGETRVVEGLTPDVPVPASAGVAEAGGEPADEPAGPATPPGPRAAPPPGPPPAPPAPPESPPGPRPGTQEKPSSRRGRLVLLGAGAAVVAAVVVGATLASGGSDESAPSATTAITPTSASATTEPEDTTTSSAVAGSVGALRPEAIVASSTAPPGFDSSFGVVNYDAELAIDGLPDTTWRTPGDGVGETLVLSFGRPVHVTGVALLPGYAKFDPSDGTDRFVQNRRVVAARYHFDGRDPVTVRFDDAPRLQGTGVDAVTEEITIEITETTTEPERDFTAISEIEVVGAEVTGG